MKIKIKLFKFNLFRKLGNNVKNLRLDSCFFMLFKIPLIKFM